MSLCRDFSTETENRRPGVGSTVVLDVVCCELQVSLLSSSPVSAPVVPQQPPNSRHIPLYEERPPQHSDASAAADSLWSWGGSLNPDTAPPAAAGRNAQRKGCQYPIIPKWNRKIVRPRTCSDSSLILNHCQRRFTVGLPPRYMLM